MHLGDLLYWPLDDPLHWHLDDVLDEHLLPDDLFDHLCENASLAI